MIVNKVAVMEAEVEANRHYKCDVDMPFEAYNVVSNPKQHTIMFSVVAGVIGTIFALILSLTLIYGTGDTENILDVIGIILIAIIMSGGFLGSLYALIRIIKNYNRLVERLIELEYTLKNGLVAIPTIVSIKQARQSSGKSSFIDIVVKYTYLNADGNTVGGEFNFTESVKIKELNPIAIAFCNERTFVLKRFTLLDEPLEIKPNITPPPVQEVCKFYRLDSTSYSINICPDVPQSIFFKAKGLLISGFSILLLFSAVSLVSAYLPVNPNAKIAVTTLLFGIALSIAPLTLGIYRLVRNIKTRNRFNLAQENGYLALVSASRTVNEHVSEFYKDFYRIKVTCQFVDFEDKNRQFEFYVDSPDKKDVSNFDEIALLVHNDSIYYLTNHTAKFPLKKPA